MCGIVGSINFKINTSKVDAVMGHRGPDERNLYKWNTIELYHLRLAILDVQGGKQPMHFEEKYSIFFAFSLSLIN